jgi:hypothetical protein
LRVEAGQEGPASKLHPGYGPNAWWGCLTIESVTDDGARSGDHACRLA